jgi:hypothetical protein
VYNINSNEAEHCHEQEQSTIEKQYEEMALIEEEDNDDRVTNVCLVQDHELCFDDIISADTNPNQEQILSKEINASPDICQDQRTSTSHQPDPDILINTASCSNSSHLCQVNPTSEPSIVSNSVKKSTTCSKTKLGKAVEVVLGSTKDVTKFDSARDLLKKNSKMQRYCERL